MFGMHAPGTHPVFRFEFHDRDPLAVVGKKTLVRDVARHLFGQFIHALGQSEIFLTHVRHEAGPKNSDDHRESPNAPGSCWRRPQIDVLNRSYRASRYVRQTHYSALASIVSM